MMITFIETYSALKAPKKLTMKKIIKQQICVQINNFKMVYQKMSITKITKLIETCSSLKALKKHVLKKSPSNYNT